MRKFVVGDLHGSMDLFDKVLLDIDFDFNEDVMYSVGDLIDRGTDSMNCLRLLKQPWFHAVRGNHEDFLIHAILSGGNPYDWYMNGGLWSKKVDQDELKELAVLAEQLPYAITVGDVGICHAQAPSYDWNDTKNLTDRQKEKMIWSRNTYNRNDETNIANIDKVYVGHTIVRETEIIGNTVFIDTGAYYYGKLTCVGI